MLFHEPTQSLVFHAPDPLAIRELIPKSKLLPGEFNIAVRHDVAATKILRNLELNVPAPINTIYDWPGKYKPHSHQRVMAEFMTLHHRCFNLSEMGTEKTASSLWAADWLMKQGKVRRVLIVTPLSTMKTVWANDIFDVLMHRVVVVAHGSREQRLKALDTPADFYIINHEGMTIKPIVNAIRQRPDIDLVIVDEGSKFRNHDTDKYRGLKAMLRPDQRLWWLTGTPCPNSPVDVWSQDRLVNSSKVPQFLGAFRRATMEPLDSHGYKWKPGPNRPKILKPSLHRAISNSAG